jgi:Putative Actinobacterial Holin-X, holin superfamily III
MSTATKLVSDKLNSIIGRELGRAAAELKKKLLAVGLGIAMLVVAALLAVFGLGLGLATIAAALATVFSTWLALLIVTGGVFVLAGVLVLLGIRRISKKTPTLDEQALPETAASRRS